MEYNSRYDVVKAALYPIRKGQSLFESVSDGVTIQDWSPHNLRDMIVSPQMVWLNWYVSTNSTGLSLRKAFRDYVVDEKTKSLSELVFHRGNKGRQFSNIEEVVFCGYSGYEDLLRLDISAISLDIAKTLKRLIGVVIINADIQVVKELRDKAIANGVSIAQQAHRDGVSMDVIYSCAKGGYTVANCKNYMFTDSSRYAIDTKVKVKLQSLLDEYNRGIKTSSDETSKSGITAAGWQKVMSKQYADKLPNVTYRVNLGLSSLVDKYYATTDKLSRGIARELVCKYEKNDTYKSLAVQMIVGGQNAFGRGTNFDDGGSSPQLNQLAIWCNKLGVSFKDANDTNLEDYLRVLIRYTVLILSIYYMGSVYKQVGKVISGLQITPLLKFGMQGYVKQSPEEFEAFTSAVSISDKEYGLYFRCTSDASDTLIGLGKIIEMLKGYVADTDDGDNFDLDADDDYDDYDEDIDEGEPENYDDYDLDADDTSEIINAYIAFKDSVLALSKISIDFELLSKLVIERLDLDLTLQGELPVVKSGNEGTVNIWFEYQELCTLYLTLYMRIYRTLPFARNMFMSLFTSSNYIYDDRVVEVLNKYLGVKLVGFNKDIGCSEYLAFAHKVKVDDFTNKAACVAELLPRSNALWEGVSYDVQ